MIRVIIPTALCIAFATVFILLRTKKKVYGCLVFKTLAALSFLATGILASTISKTSDNFTLLVLTGLSLGVLGDVAMQFKYFNQKYFKLFLVVGLGLFAIGHFFYLGAIYSTYEVYVLPFVISLVLSVLVYFGLSMERFKSVGKLKIVACCYFFLLSLLVFTSLVGLIKAPSTRGIMLLVGTAFFLTSDMILSFIYFGGAKQRRVTVINLVTYYIAQLALAWSILM